MYAIGSHFGPVLANFLWVIMKQYVDDIIYLTNCESEADRFLNFLNTQHSNIKFTFEKQVNNQISFLDVNLALWFSAKNLRLVYLLIIEVLHLFL